MEINIPIHVPEDTIRRIVVENLEDIFVALNHAHGLCMNENEENTKIFSTDPEREKELLEEAIKGLNLVHQFYLNESYRLKNVIERVGLIDGKPF